MRTEEGVIYTTLLNNVLSHTEDESWGEGLLGTAIDRTSASLRRRMHQIHTDQGRRRFAERAEPAVEDRDHVGRPIQPRQSGIGDETKRGVVASNRKAVGLVRKLVGRDRE